MADTIPDLWLSSELKTTVLTPIAILRTQANLLGQKTQGLLVGDVRVTSGEKGQVILSFDVIAPALNSYRYNLLSVRHTKDASYPAAISAQIFITPEKINNMSVLKGIGLGSETAYSDRQFIALVQEVLQAQETVARLQSLIVRSNEEVVGSPFTKDENTEQSDDEKE